MFTARFCVARALAAAVPMCATTGAFAQVADQASASLPTIVVTA
jgi:hypothetical protein